MLPCGSPNGLNQKRPSDYATNIHSDSLAFCISNIVIETKGSKRLCGAACLTIQPNDVRKMWITFHTQKNGQNGEKGMYTNGFQHLSGHRSFIQAMYRILHLRTVNSRAMVIPLLHW